MEARLDRHLMRQPDHAIVVSDGAFSVVTKTTQVLDV